MLLLSKKVTFSCYFYLTKLNWKYNVAHIKNYSFHFTFNTFIKWKYNVAPTDASDGKIEITIQLALFGIITMVRNCHHIFLNKLLEFIPNSGIITMVENHKSFFWTNCYKLLQIVINYYKLLQIITNYYKLLQIISATVLQMLFFSEREGSNPYNKLWENLDVEWHVSQVMFQKTNTNLIRRQIRIWSEDKYKYVLGSHSSKFWFWLLVKYQLQLWIYDMFLSSEEKYKYVLCSSQKSFINIFVLIVGKIPIEIMNLWHVFQAMF